MHKANIRTKIGQSEQRTLDKRIKEKEEREKEIYGNRGRPTM